MTPDESTRVWRKTARRAQRGTPAGRHAIATAGLTWAYRGVNVYRTGLNTSGMRWYAISSPGAPGTLKADTKAGMRALISHYIDNPAS